MTHSVNMNSKREAFFQDVKMMDADKLFQKYFPNTTRVKAERIIRRLCVRLGIYRFLLRAYKSVVKKL
jgi:hypothetical protein